MSDRVVPRRRERPGQHADQPIGATTTGRAAPSGEFPVVQVPAPSSQRSGATTGAIPIVDPARSDLPVTDITGPQVRATPNLARIWRDRAQWAVRGVHAPTMAIALPGSDDALSQRHARAVIDLALRVGEAMMSTGAPASDVTATVLRITSAYGVRSAHVDITFTSITVSIHRGLDDDPLTVVRVVAVRSTDYSRLQRVQVLVDRIASAADSDREPPDVDDARRELEQELGAPHPYRRWVLTAANALLAAAVVALLGAQPGLWLVAAGTAAVVDRVQRRLARGAIAAFFNQAVSAAIPMLVAIAVFWLDSRGIEIPGVSSPSLVVIAGIIVLLAGLTVMGAAKDALDGYYVTAGARGLEVLVMTAGIAVGISLTLSIANGFMQLPELNPELQVPMVTVLQDPAGALQGIIAAALIGFAYAVSTYAPPRTALVAGAVAAIGWIVFTSIQAAAPGHATAVAAAAAVVGVLGYVAHRTLRVPEAAVTTAGIITMLPGLAVYRMLYWLMTEPDERMLDAMGEFLHAVSVGLGLAAGVTIGLFLARRRMGWDAATARATRRARGGFR